MAANWGTFEQQLTKYFNDKNAENLQAAASTIAQYYHSAVGSAMIITIPGATGLGLAPSPIENGFKSSFQTALDGKGNKITPSTFTAAANGVIQYWTGKSFVPSAVPPGMVITTSNTVTFPGVPAPLASQLNQAFQHSEADQTVRIMKSAFQGHLQTIAGVWNGLMPSPTGPVTAPPFPWTGIA
jgi:hypothetical protein